MTSFRTAEPVFWQDAEPARLERDRKEVAEFAPKLEYHDSNQSGDGDNIHGGWSGELPLWPFERSMPEGLHELIGTTGLKVAVMYSAAHPMIAPTIYPLSIHPTVHEESRSVWHVAPGGSLCLLQSDGAWNPEASVTELLAKAAGWRIEYALMKRGAIQEMSLRGIVTDPSFDHLITEFASAEDVAEYPDIEDPVVQS